MLMQGNRERAALLYCERVFDPKKYYPGYEAASWQNADCILDRYRKMAESILRESQGLDVELSVVKTEGPLIGLSGPPEAIEKALKKILGDFALPPETKIVLPGKYTEYNGSSETGYAIARKVVTEMGHRLKRSGEILRRSFKLKPNA